jgi:BirA family biotin operon repressor/biotin-[acetyl-CoA-carboxylase] ligase
MAAPPRELMDSLVGGPSLVTAVEWHEQVDSTNVRATRAAAEGVGEGLLVLADEQTAGRGRRGRSWHAPAGTSLLMSLVLRESARVDRGLVPLAAGLALAEAAAAHVQPAEVALSWPNDLLVRGTDGSWHKAAGTLVEASGDAVVVGVGVDVDWRGVNRTELGDLGPAGSLAEACDCDVDRWRLLAAYCGLLGHRLADGADEPARLLDAYRQRCRTLGESVRAALPDGTVLEGRATDIAEDGALVLDAGDATHQLRAADVTHLDDRFDQP